MVSFLRNWTKVKSTPGLTRPKVLLKKHDVILHVLRVCIRIVSLQSNKCRMPKPDYRWPKLI